MALPAWTEIEDKARRFESLTTLEKLVFTYEPAIGRMYGLTGKHHFRQLLEDALAEVAQPVAGLRKENAALEYLRCAVVDAVEHWDRTSEHKTAVLAFALDECNKRRLA